MKKPRFSESQIFQVLNEAEAGVPVPELCRKHGMSSASIYKWRAKYGAWTRGNTRKHLLTLQPAISEAQTSEMQGKELQLIVPAPYQAGYTDAQRDWLMTVDDFLQDVRMAQQSL